MQFDASACPLWLYRFLPFLRWWPMVNRASLKSDVLAGLTGAIIVLPQSVAFAIIAGLPPEYGLYAAMVPTIVAALFGSSWHLVSGPTTAISIVVFGSLRPLEARRRQKMGGGLYLVGVQPGFCAMLREGGHVDHVGQENIYGHKGEAISKVYPRLNSEICRTCTARIFTECDTALPNGEKR